MDEIDTPLNFNGLGFEVHQPDNGYDRSLDPGQIGSNAELRRTVDRFGEFGTEGGKASSRFCASVRANLHHEETYRPFTVLVDGKAYTQEEWKEHQKET